MPYMLRQRMTLKSDLSGTPTWRYKLPSIGRYTALEIVVDCDRYQARADGAVVYPLEAMISKIELLEGASRALISLTGAQLDASGYWDFKRPTPRRYRQEAGTGNQTHLFLMGGRDLYDREYGFDFARLAETYLEYTHSITADTAEKFDASDHKVSIYGWRWMGADAPSFKGYRRIRQLAAWSTSAADTIKVVEIPVGNPIRRIAIQAKTRAATLGGTIKEIELRVNDGEYSPVHIQSPLHWTMQEVSDYELENLVGGIDYQYGAGSIDLPYWFSYYETITLEQYASIFTDLYVLGLITAPARVHQSTSEAGQFIFNSRGWGFQKCLRIGFDHDRDGFDLLKTQGMGSLDLELTEAAASRDAAVFVEDLLNY